MGMRILCALSTLFAVAFLAIGALRARADSFVFDDSQPGGVTVIANGFLGSAFTVNGSLAVTNGTYVNQFVTLPKGQDITFSGTTSGFSTPYTFSTTYEFLPYAGATSPLAELILSGQALSNAEAFSGTFIGFSDPNLPASVTVGTNAVVAGAGDTLVVNSTTYDHAYGQTLGTGPNTTFLGVIADAPAAAPLPSSFFGGLTLLTCVGAMIALRRWSGFGGRGSRA